MSEWQPIETAMENGNKIVVVCDDGCSAFIALVTDEGILDAEDGGLIIPSALRGAIWMPLPDNYPLHFMEMHDDY